MNDSTIFLPVSLVSLVLCLLLTWYYRNSKKLLDEMWAVDTYDARELRLMCKDNFNAIVEVDGIISCDAPITSLHSQFPCCWFRTIVKRESEKHHSITITDSNGHEHVQAEVSTDWKTIFDHTFTTIFKVNDQTGYTLVDPEKADIESEKISDTIVDGPEPWFYDIGLASPHAKSILEKLFLPVEWFGDSMLSDTGRYRIIEEVFFPVGNVYVLGEATSYLDGALIRYPSSGYLDPKKKFFIISRKSEKQLTRSNQISTSVCFWGAIVAFLLSAYCALCALGFIGIPSVFNM